MAAKSVWIKKRTRKKQAELAVQVFQAMNLAITQNK